MPLIVDVTRFSFLGWSLGSVVGAHTGGEGKGEIILSLLGSIGVTAASIAVAEHNNSDALYLPFAALQIGALSLIEKLTR